MDRGAWWATVHGVPKGQTQQKRRATHERAQVRPEVAARLRQASPAAHAAEREHVVRCVKMTVKP